MHALQQLTDAFANAPFAADGWYRALHLMGALTGSSRGQLMVFSPRYFTLNLCTDMDEAAHANFARIDGFRREVNWRIAAEGGIGEIIHEAHYNAARRRNMSEAYLDHVRRFDCELGMQTVIARSDTTSFGLASLRGRSDGASTEEDRDSFAHALQPALAAIRMQVAMENQGADLLRGALDALRVAAALIDSHGQLCATTPAMDAVLASGCFRLAGRRLIGADPRVDAPMQARIAAALAGLDSSGPDLWVRVSGKPCLLEVNGLPRQEWAFGFAPRAIVTFRFPIPLAREDAVRLSAALPLTIAEAEVVALLAAGLPRGGIAAARGTSLATVTSQLRAIFAKCAVQREAELVTLAVTLLAPR